MTLPLRVIIDTDPGIDDVITLALAALSPEIEIVAVTTSYGNATLQAAHRNATEVLNLAGVTGLRILPGADRPLVRGLVTAPETHGDSGVGYAAVRREDEVTPNPTVLIDVLSGLSAPVTLVTLGPLTNLAHAVRTDPRMVRSRLDRHIGMFGNLHEQGNTNRWADFNAWCDPEAVGVVFDAGLPVEMVGLDVTRRMTLSSTEVQRIRESRPALSRWLGDALRFYVEFHRAQERLDGCVVNDVLTIAELIDPGLLRFADLELTVDLDEGSHRGHTREATAGSMVRVALDVDVQRVRRLLHRVFGAGSWEDASLQGARS